MRIERVYHHYSKWEDNKHGMYRFVTEIDTDMINKAKDLLIDCNLLYDSMKTVCVEWKCSAEVNMSNTSRNRQAWLGQASCCYVYGCPEELTRFAWHMLSREEQNRANAVADRVIAEWEKDWSLQGQLYLEI